MNQKDDDISGRGRAEFAAEEQRQLLELVATGQPLEECLTEITAMVARLQPGARACILLADDAREKFSSSYAADMPASFGRGVKDAPVNELAIGTCGEAVYRGEAVTCPDIASDMRWSQPWRELCVAHGILACHSEPVTAPDKRCVASLMICFDEAREPSAWERQIARFGAHIAAIAIAHDKAARELREREERLRLIVESAKEFAIITFDPGGFITSWNSGAERILGYSEQEVVGRHGRMFFSPQDQEEGRAEAEMEIAQRIGRAENERWHQRKDGSRFWASGLMLPLTEGSRHGFLKIFRDLTERKQAEEHKELMIDELNHRVKNTLATVQAIIAQGLKGTDREVAENIESRLIALSQSHDLLTREQWAGANLQDVVKQALSPFGADDGGRQFEIEGEPFRLRPKLTLSLGMGLHELATNAVKYGALSVPSGRVRVSWTVVPAEGGDRLRLVWVENGGPAVHPPSRKGFGSRLLERGLGQDLGGTVNLEYAPEGVICTIDMPAERPGRG